MEKFRGDFQAIYHREEPHPTGLPLATHVNPANMKDDIPSEAEVEAAVRRLRLHRACGNNHIRAEHFKQWKGRPNQGNSRKTHRRGNDGRSW